MELDLPIRLQTLARADPDERCELCGVGLDPRHSHLVEPSVRRLLCSCRACALLFSRQAETRFLLVPETVRRLPPLKVPAELWARLIMPVRLVFFFHSTPDDRVVALYPSPAGATEAQLEDGLWDELVAIEPRLAKLRPDVEALLVNRLEGDGEFFIAPLDRCYELVGRIRRGWKGLSGGTEVWREVTGFFQALAREAQPT